MLRSHSCESHRLMWKAGCDGGGKEVAGSVFDDVMGYRLDIFYQNIAIRNNPVDCTIEVILFR